MSMPVASILIPNFNNGRLRSRDGTRDFIGDLLRSLEATLSDEPTPFEVLVADDGSTDDSLATCRAWARRSWPDGRPFLRLIERPHRGVLSQVLNDLMREARGSYFFRLDGDIVVHTPRWVSALCRVFESAPPDLGIIGPKQLTPNGRIHCCGDWILHPLGYHHAWQGAPRHAATEPFEVDDIMGCFHCMKRAVWESVGDYDESILRGQTNDYSLLARRGGWRLMYTPAVEFTHFHAERGWRENVADTESGLAEALDRVRAKWGFDRLAPDLRAVRERWAGTPLLWNQTVWAGADAPRRLHPTPLEDSPWQAFGGDQSALHTLEGHASIAFQAIGHAQARCGRLPAVVFFGTDAGVLAHILAQRGIETTSVQHHPGDATLGASVVERARYPGPVPRVVHADGRDRWPLDDRAADLVLLVGCLEHHWNPVGVLLEAHRVLRETGSVMVRTAWRPTFEEPEAGDGGHRYRAHELQLQLRHTGRFEATIPPLEPPPDGWLTTLLNRAETRAAHGHFSATGRR
ncbi:MAG: glycosyltransferase [Phycisphaerales bacterium]|nr:glycosyltransferase [Phycisphaerales bacterium]